MANTKILVDLDEFDRKIIAILGRDGRMTYTELAQRVGLSKTPCQQRVKRLVDSGLITGFRAIVDPAKLGLQIPEVEECHMIASSFDYLLKVRTPDIRRYRIVLGEKISSLPHVASTSTFVAMETICESAR